MPRKDVYTVSDEERIISLTEAAHIIGVHPETLKRNYQKYILTLSARRRGMKLKHVKEIVRDRS